MLASMNGFVAGKSISRKKVVWTGGVTRTKRVEKVVEVPPFDLLNVLKRPLEEIGDDALVAGLDGAFVGQRERDNWATIGT